MTSNESSSSLTYSTQAELKPSKAWLGLAHFHPQLPSTDCCNNNWVGVSCPTKPQHTVSTTSTSTTLTSPNPTLFPPLQVTFPASIFFPSQTPTTSSAQYPSHYDISCGNTSLNIFVGQNPLLIRTVHRQFFSRSQKSTLTIFRINN